MTTKCTPPNPQPPPITPFFVPLKSLLFGTRSFGRRRRCCTNTLLLHTNHDPQNERHARLREQARQLIASKAKPPRLLNLDSPSSPTKLINASAQRAVNFSPERTISPINNQPEFIFPSVTMAMRNKDSPGGTDGSDANSNLLLKRASPSPNKVSPSLLEALITPKNEGRVRFFVLIDIASLTCMVDTTSSKPLNLLMSCGFQNSKKKLSSCRWKRSTTSRAS